VRAVAEALSGQTTVQVHAVSWKHSDRIPASELDGTPAWTLGAFVRSFHARGEREFVFIPFFISAQGAIGSALREDLAELRRELNAAPFEFLFSQGLAERGAVPAIVAARIRDLVAERQLIAPHVVVVDHGGPSVKSAALRDALAMEVRSLLGPEIDSLTAVSMEGAQPPLLADHLRDHAGGSEIVVAPLFLSPGRHAGPDGDLRRICAASPNRCHLTELVGTHPLAVDALAAGLRFTLSTLHAPSFA
jgi:sirohydrochlorin ferrochelatase